MVFRTKLSPLVQLRKSNRNTLNSSYTTFPSQALPLVSHISPLSISWVDCFGKVCSAMCFVEDSKICSPHTLKWDYERIPNLAERELMPITLITNRLQIFVSSWRDWQLVLIDQRDLTGSAGLAGFAPMDTHSSFNSHLNLLTLMQKR